jgi:uncharacterized protein with GYD domain
MLTYIALLTFTEKGIRDVKQTAKRADAFNDLAEKNGIKIINTFWLNGPFDGIHIFEVANEDQAMVHSLSLSSFGNVKTQTFRAYSKREILPLLESIPEASDLAKGI